MSKELQLHSAKIASAALRHDFGIPLNTIGRNALFIDDYIKQRSSNFLNSNDEEKLSKLCEKAAQDADLLNDKLRSFGRAIEPSYRSGKTNDAVVIELQARFARLNHDVSPMFGTIVETCRQIHRTVEAQTNPPDAVASRSRRARESIDRAQAMYSGLSHFFRITELDAHTFALTDLVKLISTIAAAVRRERQSHVVQEIPVIGRGSAEIIESQMNLIIQNLLLNALKFTALASTPKIDVSVTEAHFFGLQQKYHNQLAKYAARGDWLEINFVDNGSGVDDDHVSSIFNLYYTNSPEHIDKGTGMGLSIAKLVATLHRGCLFLAKSRNPTTFCLAIPQEYKNGISINSLTKLEYAL